MDASTSAAYHAQRDRVLWHVVGGNPDERYGPRTRWWNDNHGRKPAGIVVFQIVLEGRCVLRRKDGDTEVGAGQAFLFTYDELTAYGRPPDRLDWPGWSDSLRMAHVTLGGAGLSEHWNVLRARIGPVITLGESSRCTDLVVDIQRFAKRADRRAASPAVHAFIMTLFDEIEAEAARGLGPVEGAINEMLRAPLAVTSLKAIARRHRCAREHLTRVFAERIGMPPARWLRQARLTRALELLRATHLPLTDIAAQAGFVSTRTLARLVARTTGGSAGAQRRRRSSSQP
ncbi:MAG: AraC family transcriptional regulator [Planctomycetes bacterium]|nr:AraC family transcriptional regulator [Planctomycetota bacterium]